MAASASNGHTTADVAQTTYNGFGSFHSESVEDMVAACDTLYKPPSVPSFAVYAPPDGTNPRTPVEFGSSLRRTMFRISPDCTFVNHGAFGGALAAGMDVRRAYEALGEAQVLRFMDRTVLPLMVWSVRRLANFLNCHRQELVLCPNATYGLNCAMQLIQPRDRVVYFDCEYLSVYHMIAHRCEAVGAGLQELPINRLLREDPDTLADDEKLTRYIEEKLPEGVEVVVVDHVTSSAAMMMPIFSHIIPMLRRRGVRDVIVDGAHGPMQFPLNFEALPNEARPTVYVGNLHKWFCAPKSVGFLWAPREVQPRVPPLVVSHGFTSGFLSSYVWDGTRDYSASLTIPFLVDFWTWGIPQKEVREKCGTLLERVRKELGEAFRTAPVARHAPMMTLVALPEALQRAAAEDRITGTLIQDTLLYDYAVECPVKRIEGVLYLRVSCFIYNDMHDYEILRDAILKITESVEKGILHSPVGEKRPRVESNCGIGVGTAPPSNRVKRF